MRSNHQKMVFVGGLTERVTKLLLEETLFEFGIIKNIWLAARPPGFAFVLFEDEESARNAIRYANGRTLDNRVIGVKRYRKNYRRKHNNFNNRNYSPKN